MKAAMLSTFVLLLTLSVFGDEKDTTRRPALGHEIKLKSILEGCSDLQRVSGEYKKKENLKYANHYMMLAKKKKLEALASAYRFITTKKDDCEKREGKERNQALIDHCKNECNSLSAEIAKLVPNETLESVIETYGRTINFNPYYMNAFSMGSVTVTAQTRNAKGVSVSTPSVRSVSTPSVRSVSTRPVRSVSTRPVRSVSTRPIRRVPVYPYTQKRTTPFPVFPAPAIATPKRTVIPGYTGSRYDPDSLANPYGAGSPYKADGLMNPYSQYGSRYSNKSWTNPYATDAPRLYDSQGNYRGKLSTNRYDPDSTSNPYGRYGSKYSPDSINNPYGAGNPYSLDPIYVIPSQNY